MVWVSESRRYLVVQFCFMAAVVVMTVGIGVIVAAAVIAILVGAHWLCQCLFPCLCCCDCVSAC